MKTTVACVPCPACESRDARRVCWTPWGGLIGPLLLGLVRCRACGVRYRARTGEPERTVIRRFHPVLASLTVGLVAFIAVVGFYWWW